MKFFVKFRTLGMNFVAGEVVADCVENAKRRAGELLRSRNIKRIEYAAIVESDGSESALLNVDRFNLPGVNRSVEWLTVRNRGK